MAFQDFVLSFFTDPTGVIVSAAIVFLLASTVRDGKRKYRQPSRLRDHLLADTMLHFRPNDRVRPMSLRKLAAGMTGYRSH